MFGRRLIAGSLVLGTLVALGGCWRPGGRGVSGDAFTYISTAYEPKTVSVIDTRSGQTVWSYDVPVGRQLDLQFFEADKLKNPSNPDKIKWRETSAGNLFGVLSEELTGMPPADARRIDLKVRPGPEFPPPTPPGTGSGGHG